MNFKPDDIIKSCPRLESGLRFGPEGICACQLGAFNAPVFWTADEAAGISITKEMIEEKRHWLLETLNDAASDISCKRCLMVVDKCYGDIDLTQLGQIDLAARTICNLRCKFCGIAVENLFSEDRFNTLAILQQFSARDVQWDSVVDFNGGEPTLLDNLEAYLDYFRSRNIRIRFMTNGVLYHPLVDEGLRSGSIQWVCTSVDAGTPSTYLRIKRRDYYLQVLENLTRYAHAGRQGGGKLAIKYIFCGDNCGDDDIAGFTYAMLAIQPNQVWLTYDFSVVGGDALEFGAYDFSRDVAAYAKMFNLMKKHGITPVHYSIGHLALVSAKGKQLMERTLKAIDAGTAGDRDPILDLTRPGQESSSHEVVPLSFATTPLRIVNNNRNGSEWSLKNKRVLLAPACRMTIDLLSDPQVQEGHLVGFLDRDRIIHGKRIQGLPIFGYEAIGTQRPDVVLVDAPPQHLTEILMQIEAHVTDSVQVAVRQYPE